MIQKMLDERLMDAKDKKNLGEVASEGDNNITEMLNNMDIFGQIQRNYKLIHCLTSILML